MSGMRCTREKCPIKELTDGASICTAHDCSYRTEPMTNADRIRAMPDEELAQEILRRWRAEMETGKFEDISTRWCDMKGGCVSSKGYHRPCTEDRLLACIKRWLRQPAEAQT